MVHFVRKFIQGWVCDKRKKIERWFGGRFLEFHLTFLFSLNHESWIGDWGFGLGGVFRGTQKRYMSNKQQLTGLRFVGPTQFLSLDFVSPHFLTRLSWAFLGPSLALFPMRLHYARFGFLYFPLWNSFFFFFFHFFNKSYVDKYFLNNPYINTIIYQKNLNNLIHIFDSHYSEYTIIYQK